MIRYARMMKKSLERISHKIRHMATDMGAGKLSDEAFRFELAVRKGDKDKLSVIFNNIVKAFDEFCKTVSHSNLNGSN